MAIKCRLNVVISENVQKPTHTQTHSKIVKWKKMLKKCGLLNVVISGSRTDHEM